MMEQNQPKPEYPVDLIPNVKYRMEMDLSTVYQTGNHFYTQRKASCSQDECVNELGEVTEKAIYDTEVEDDRKGYDLEGMSLNMMGTPHLPEYGKWRQKNPGSKYWDGTNVQIDSYADSYEFNENQAFVYLDACSLEGLPIPYIIQFPDRSVYDKFKEIPGVYGNEFSRTTGYAVTGQLRHLHRPTFLNYWHTELWICHPEIDFKHRNLKRKQEWREKLQRQFVELLRLNATIVLPDHNEFPEATYMK